MITTFFVVVCLLILAGLIFGIVDQDTGDYVGFNVVGIIIMVLVLLIGIVYINNPIIKKEKTLIIPELKIETKVIEGKVISSDTTYIYTFSN